MSIINRMLRELDRRRAAGDEGDAALRAQVRAVVPASRGSAEWFWRVVAMLLFLAAGWTVWVIYQLQPRTVATELAHRAAESTRRRAPLAPGSAPALAGAQQSSQAAVTAPAAPAAASKPVPERLAAPIETLRLALTIDTPLAPRPPQAASKAASDSPARQVAEPVARPAGTPPGGAVRVEKRDRERAPGDRAELEYRRAAALLNGGRVADAEDALRRALAEDNRHHAARQTLIALYLEQGRIEDALQHLREGLDANPAYVPFGVALARIHVDRRNYEEALKVLEPVRATAQGNPDFHALRGAVLQRLSRHNEAADAYRQALNSGAQTGTSWVGLGISLEAQGMRPEAAEAFRRGIATGTLAPDVRAYVDQRLAYLK
jgi:MSHA biogenesis protein MshN